MSTSPSRHLGGRKNSSMYARRGRRGVRDDVMMLRPSRPHHCNDNNQEKRENKRKLRREGGRRTADEE